VTKPRRLLLLRHGKAEPIEYGTPDFDRPLIKRGREAAKLVGKHMAAEKIAPDRVLCSPSARTRETLDRLLKALKAKPELLFPDPLYNAATETYLDQIREHGGKAKTLMVVGHNPSTEDALVRLTANPGDLPVSFPTGAMAILEFEGDSWDDLAERSGRLVAFVNPRDLAED
jgi:phosphohistidine phosphatase